MTDILVEVENSSGRLSRPSLAQVRAVVDFMQKHPELGNRKLRYGSQDKFRKLWTELSNIVNSMEGSFKSTKGWIKFWSDKRRSLKLKQKQIEDGKLKERLSSLEQKILDLSFDERNLTKKKKGERVKQEPCNGNDDDDDDSMEDIYENDGLEFNQTENGIIVTEADERQISLMEKLVDVMNQQASAMSQIAQASLSNSKALERLADASHIQALAVDRLANTFENVSATIHDVRNAIVSIDYTMKRCYSATTTQHRQNSNLFS